MARWRRRAEFIPLMVEIFRDVKAIFKDNPVELFTKGTGGSEFRFYRQRGLEEAIQQIGEQLHSQYMISYTPNNRTRADSTSWKSRSARTRRRPAPDIGWGQSSKLALARFPPAGCWRPKRLR